VTRAPRPGAASTDSPELSRRFAQLETSLEPQRQRSVARGPIGLIGVLAVLCLAVGTVAAIDFRRLQTPEGAALSWTGAAVFGDCVAFERRSVPVPGRPDRRTAEERCEDLQEQTQSAREESARYSIEVLSVQEREQAATVRVRVGRPDGERTQTQTVDLLLEQRDQGWVVLRTAEACRAVRCP
jgi:hypothetical protein